jgi:hypothetical protein
MSLTAKFERACRRTVKNFHTSHPFIYAACKFIIHEGLHYALDACGTLLGDPLLFEEIEAIYFGMKMAVNISFKLYHYLKSKSHIHGQQIEHMAHHERGHSGQHAVGRAVGHAVGRAVHQARSWKQDEYELDNEDSDDDGGDDDGEDDDADDNGEDEDDDCW